MRILQREAQIHVQSVTFNENPAAGTSNPRSRSLLLMRILQREAQIHVQGPHF